MGPGGNARVAFATGSGQRGAMSDNMIFQALAIAALALHLAVLGAGLLGWRRAMPMLNAVMALAVLAWLLARLPRLIAPPADLTMLALLGFEIFVLRLALLASRGSGSAARLSWLVFALHLAASAAAAVFALTFRMERLF